MNLFYIHWNPDPVLFHIGNFGLRRNKKTDEKG